MIKDFVYAESMNHAEAMRKQGYVFLAGGTQVNSTSFKKRGKSVENVVSLNPLKLEGISTRGENTVIGAMTRLQDIADSTHVPDALRQAAGFIPTRSIRNIATLGGNVGANRPDSYIIPVLLALDTKLQTANSSEISVETYLSEAREDLILEFLIPPVKGCCTAIKESRSHHASPVVSAAVRLVAKDGKISQAAVYAGCIAPHVIKLTEAEKAIMNGADVEQAIMETIHPKDDILGSANFKRYLNAVKIADAVEFCGKRVLS